MQTTKPATPVSPVFNSSITVFADLVEDEMVARQNYLSKRKTGTKKEIEDALTELKFASNKVAEMVHVIRNKSSAGRRRETVSANGGGYLKAS